ncbi:MAG: hypothetical protein ACYS15_11755 [Planctomycetota bacterium]|jgi:hypothetical protein
MDISSLRYLCRRLTLSAALIVTTAVAACKEETLAPETATGLEDKPTQRPVNRTSPDEVMLMLDKVRVEDVVPFLEEETGKDVTLSDEAGRHRFTLISADSMSREAAAMRILDKLRLDGLRIIETPNTIEIELPNRQ